MERPVERRRGAGHRGVRIGVRAADVAHRAGAAVLFVVGVQDEQHVQGPFQHRVGPVDGLVLLEELTQEAAGVAELAVRIDVGLADAVAIGVGGDARHLRDQSNRLQAPRRGVVDGLCEGIERREGADGAQEDAHGVGVVAEALDDLLDVLVQHHVLGEILLPLRQLALVGQLAMDEQMGGLDERAAFRELLDRVAPIPQNALLPVDERDRAPAGGGVQERRVVGHHPEVVRVDPYLPEIRGANGVVGHRDLVLSSGAVVGNRQRISHVCSRLFPFGNRIVPGRPGQRPRCIRPAVLPARTALFLEAALLRGRLCPNAPSPRPVARAPCSPPAPSPVSVRREVLPRVTRESDRASEPALAAGDDTAVQGCPSESSSPAAAASSPGTRYRPSTQFRRSSSLQRSLQNGAHFGATARFRQ